MAGGCYESEHRPFETPTMRIGIFSDSHDHLDNVRKVVDLFNQRGCELVLFAGDLVSTITIPPLRALKCPLPL